MDRKTELTEKLAPLRAELYEIEAAEKDAANHALVGKCFGGRNPGCVLPIKATMLFQKTCAVEARME